MENNPLVVLFVAVLVGTITGVVDWFRRGKKLNGLQHTQTSTKETIINLNEQIAGLREDINGLRVERDAANAVVGQLGAELNQQRDEFQKQIKDLTEANQAAQASVKQFRDERDSSDTRNKKLLEENAGLNASIAQQEREIRGLEKRVNELEHQLAVQATVEKIVDALADKLTAVLERVNARPLPETGNS